MSGITRIIPTHADRINIVNARLTKPLNYHNAYGEWLTAAPGTRVLVDTDNGIALLCDDHIEIFEDEYTLE